MGINLFINYNYTALSCPIAAGDSRKYGKCYSKQLWQSWIPKWALNVLAIDIYNFNWFPFLARGLLQTFIPPLLRLSSLPHHAHTPTLTQEPKSRKQWKVSHFFPHTQPLCALSSEGIALQGQHIVTCTSQPPSRPYRDRVNESLF